MRELLSTPVADLSDAELSSLTNWLNEQYRAGDEIVADQVYDRVYRAALLERVPNDPLFSAPEPEAVKDERRYKHTAALLSTDKCYSLDEVSAWVARIEAAARSVGVDPAEVKIDVLAKLDGAAGYRYPDALVTRGKNGFGNNISALLNQGLVCTSNDIEVAGEIVVDAEFFEKNLRVQFGLKHPRNYITGLIGADELKKHHRVALDAGAVRFVVYDHMPSRSVSLAEFRSNWDALAAAVQECEYKCDGAVAQVSGDAAGLKVRGELGSTSTFHNWMSALKKNVGEQFTDVEAVELSCGRTSRIVPVLKLAGVEVDGATVTNVTAHTCARLLADGLGKGARIGLVRSGDVIPTITSVQRRSTEQVDLSRCPSCGSDTRWEGPHLYCTNKTSCPAQAMRRVEHWFSTIAVCDGMGPAVCEKLVAAGIKTPLAVYQMDLEAWAKSGISSGVAKNLIAQLRRSQTEEISDAVFLGAVGIEHLGRGDSRKLLEVIELESVTSATAAQIEAIKGFGEVTAKAVAEGLAARKDEIEGLLKLGFNLTRSKVAAGGKLEGQTIVFTGTMATAGRSDMEDEARKLGAKVSGSVTGKTTLLVCGAGVGAKKTDAAAALKVRVVSETEYRAMLAA